MKNNSQPEAEITLASCQTGLICEIVKISFLDGDLC